MGPCDGPHKGYGRMGLGVYRGPSKGDKGSSKIGSGGIEGGVDGKPV